MHRVGTVGLEVSFGRLFDVGDAAKRLGVFLFQPTQKLHQARDARMRSLKSREYLQ